MQTLGEGIMIAAALALVAVAISAGYSPYFLQWRELLRSGDWRAFGSRHRLKFFDEHSVWTVFLPLLLVAGVGLLLRHYG
jgi:hypothetical protein